MYEHLVGLILLSLIFIISFYIIHKYRYYEYQIFIPLVISAIIIIYLIYYKSKIIEGNIEGDIYEVFKESLPTEDVLEFPMEKLAKILKLLKTQLTGEEKHGYEEQCRGKFVLNKLINKPCGVGFNERVYKITKPGRNCLHTEKYKEKVPLKLCNYGEKCNIDLDCISNRCDNGICTYDLKCNYDMPGSCNYDSCMNLNDKDNDVDDFIYKNNNCTKNPCNEDTYVLCDNLDCENLGYLYKYNMDQNVCEKMNVLQNDPNEDVDTINAKITALQNLEKKYSCSNTFSQNIYGLIFDPKTDSCMLKSDMNKMTVKTIYEIKNRGTGITNYKYEYYVYENGKEKKDEGGYKGRYKGICIDGTQPNDDRTACSPCPLTEAGISGKCNTCGDGMGPNDDRTACSPCPPTKIGKKGEGCWPCGDGMEPNAAQTACVTCPLTKAGISGKCNTCGDGMEPNDDRTACSPCPPTKIGKNGKCWPCADGSAPNDERTICYWCPENSAGKAGQCSVCADGKSKAYSYTSCLSPCMSVLEDTCGEDKDDNFKKCAKCVGENQQLMHKNHCPASTIQDWCAG